jgi:hypothetical protein
MSENGQVVTEKDTIQATDYKQSVKKDDFASGSMTWVFPAYGYDFGTGQKRSKVLPREIPMYSRYAFGTHRDWTLLSTVYHESLWAQSVATAVTKGAAWGWEASGEVALRRKRLQELLLYATAGVWVGWVPFVSAHLRSYLLTGRAIVEIERERSGYGSRVTGIHHLNPLRCRFTDDPRRPVEYIDRKGVVHRLEWWQVMMFGDNVDPTEGDMAQVSSAAERAYLNGITTMEAIHVYLYEKITGSKATSIEFIQGVTEKTLSDMIASNEAEQNGRGALMYKGIIAVPIPGDIPVQRVSIPLAEMPDGFQFQEVRDNALVGYAAALQMDVNDLDPRIAQRTGLGTGAQSTILDEKTRGKGLAAWREDFTQQIHRLVAGSATTFAWSEDSTDDELKTEQLAMARQNRFKLMVEAGLLTTEQAKNMSVDAGDMPREYLETDETADLIVESEENPDEGTAEKEVQATTELIKAEMATAVGLAQNVIGDKGVEETVKEGEKKMKHLAGQHDQAAHGGGKGLASGRPGENNFDMDKAADDFLTSNLTSPVHSFDAGSAFGDGREVANPDRVDIKKAGTARLSQDAGIKETQANDILGTWAESSNDSSYQSLLLQKAASEELGSPLSEWQKDNLEVVEGNRKFSKVMISGASRNVKSAFDPQGEERGWETDDVIMAKTKKSVRALYDHTQKELADAGITEVTLYRGIIAPSKTPGRRGDTAGYSGNALESWSSDPRIAGIFSSDGARGYIVKMTVPASRVFSTSKAGFGCINEFEFVLLGNSGDTVMIVYSGGN